MLVIVGLIHLLPISGLLGSGRLKALYGLTIDDPNLLILMRHRSVLFGLLGAFLLYAAAHPALWPIGYVAGAVSVVSFLWITRSVGHANAHIARVVAADWIAVVCLLVGGVALLATG
jgi:hypothetical protein